MNFGRTTEPTKARVEMLPLIDVVFLLLVFFIYAMLSMVVRHGMKVELPGAATAMPERREAVEISIDAQNRLFVNGEPTEATGLAERVVALRGPEADKPVVIEGDRRADLGIALETLDRLKRAGVEEVSFSCEKETP